MMYKRKDFQCLFKIIVSEQSDAFSKSVRLHTGILVVRQFITVMHMTMNGNYNLHSEF